MSQSLTPAAAPSAQLRTPISTLLAWAAVFLLLGLSWQGADMRPLDLLRDSGNMGQFAADFFPPDFRDWRNYLSEMLVTVQIALWGTFLAIVVAVPAGLMCSSNIVPPWIYQPMRRLMDACRAINEMVFAMLFIVAVGLGPFAGVLALWVHTTGVLAKLFAEAVEAIDPRPVEGVRATGANALEEIVYGVIPQVMPLWISYSLYRFESNVRSASVVGIVGAGGIGMVLWEIIRSFQYAQTCAVMLIIIGFVIVTDMLSSRIRKAFI
ncbi:binding-protein-dependent transport system inner membrane protein [Bordetella ansorpii]|uniref:Binding-protein-dependent transport system inner membrane protein n=1 Tax=Bordetella ansorpii TaxID=288768 RepID=A0A157Q2D5_9BORD|nr:phosphonate ABC transporter, permease protein PhnE [Bordetella ansorpii]SAI39927.1 binding-protein-dependent transport system inner membrane protein [Bordetella ansorpii]